MYRYGLAEIKEKSSEAYCMLDSWKECYLEVRKKIEQSGRDARWEFDRKRLFERSDHIAQVCRDIYKIAQVMCVVCVGICECMCVHVFVCMKLCMYMCMYMYMYIMCMHG